MSPVFLLTILIAGLVALLPVWRLHLAGWPPRWLFTAWVVLAGSTFLAVRFPLAVRFVVPILLLAYLAPFVAGPERLGRVLRGRDTPPGVVIDVTPRPRPALRPPPPGAEDDVDQTGPADGDPAASEDPPAR